MTNLSNYVSELLRYTLFSDSDQNNEYDIRIKVDGIYFIPILPTTYVINEELYNRLFAILSVGLMPEYTLLRPLTMQIVTFNDEDISRQRALYFPFYKGQPERLTGSINDMIQLTLQTGEIPLMKAMSTKPVHILVSGNTGSGKSYFLKTLYRECDALGDTIVIDPKASDLARMTKIHPAKKTVIPDFTNNNDKGIGSRYLSKVVDVLKSAEVEMYARQGQLFVKSTKVSTDYKELGMKPLFIFIDELAALMTGSNRQIKQDFVDTLTRLAVLGRESGIYLVLSLQSARAEFVPDIVRQQCSLKVLLGRINRQTAQFLFPELTDVPMIPMGGKGTGIVSIAGDPRYSGIQPLATPTITEDK